MGKKGASGIGFRNQAKMMMSPRYGESGDSQGQLRLGDNRKGPIKISMRDQEAI